MLVILKIPQDLRNDPHLLYEKLLVNAKWLQTMDMIPDDDYTYYYRCNFEAGNADEIHYWINENRKDIALLLALKGL